MIIYFSATSVEAGAPKFNVYLLFSPHKLNPLNANFTKWSNTIKKFVGNLPTNCLSVFDHFVGLVLKGLITKNYKHDLF